MSQHLDTPRPTVPGATRDDSGYLRRLYAARFVFAVLWAVLLAVSATSLTAWTGALLVAYPVFDLAAAAHDYRRSHATGPRPALIVNMAISLVAAIGLAVAAGASTPDVLRVWGAWAVTAGFVQLVVALQRRRLGGQGAMVLSGGISVLAGAGFVATASGDGASLRGLAGYAALGGIFFALSAARLHVRARRHGAG